MLPQLPFHAARRGQNPSSPMHANGFIQIRTFEFEGLPFGSLSSMRINGDEATFVNSLPLVWNRFEQLGYATLYAENAVNGIFQADFHGFQHPPVHHYMRPFWQAIDASGQQLFRLGENPTQPGIQRQLQVCQNSYDFLFRYVEDFFDAYPKDVPKFAFALVSDVQRTFFDDDRITAESSSTDFDINFERFLSGLARSDEFGRRTVLMVLSDHGPSYGSRRTADDGVEMRQPLAAVVLPQPLVRQLSTDNPGRQAPAETLQHPQLAMSPAEAHNHTNKWSTISNNLARNADRLTSPLDIHATLLSLLDLDKLLDQV